MRKDKRYYQLLREHGSSVAWKVREQEDKNQNSIKEAILKARKKRPRIK